MSRTITLSLPDSYIEELEKIAAAANRSLDEIVSDDMLTFYTGDLETSIPLAARLKALERYSDERLKILVEWRPGVAQTERYEANAAGSIDCSDRIVRCRLCRPLLARWLRSR